jgi:hypothetical protein
MSLWIISTVSLILGLLWMYSERDLIWNGLHSYRWQHCKGRIIGTEDFSFLMPAIVGSSAAGVGVVEHHQRGYLYEYQVGLTRYVNDTYCFGVELDEANMYYIVGHHVTVYYDPANPACSVLHRGLQPGTMLSTLPVMIGAGMLIWLLCK